MGAMTAMMAPPPEMRRPRAGLERRWLVGEG